MNSVFVVRALPLVDGSLFLCLLFLFMPGGRPFRSLIYLLIPILHVSWDPCLIFLTSACCLQALKFGTVVGEGMLQVGNFGISIKGFFWLVISKLGHLWAYPSCFLRSLASFFLFGMSPSGLEILHGGRWGHAPGGEISNFQKRVFSGWLFPN